jgi:hypothetical protein
MNTEFTPLDFVKTRLLKEAIYRKDQEDWEVLRANQDKVNHFFHSVGLKLVLDEAEGFAFLDQIQIEGVDRVPKLTQRRQLSYQATLLLVCLREEFCRFDTSAPDATRLTKTVGELQDLVSAFLKESTNQVRDMSRISAAIQRLTDLGYLDKISDDPETYEVKPIIKAKLGPEQLEDIKLRLSKYANLNSDASD